MTAQAKSAKKRKTLPVRTLGKIIDISESRDLLAIKDTLGNVAELRPLDASTTLRLKLQMTLISGRAIEFWVTAPQEVAHLLEENVRIPRSVAELLHQLKNDLTGFKDDHDKVVDHYEEEQRKTLRKNRRSGKK